MLNEKLFEKPLLSRANELKKIWLYSSGCSSPSCSQSKGRWARNNAVHVAGTFKGGVTLHEMDQAILTIMQGLARHIGIGQYGLCRLGVVLMRPVPHVHMVVKSIKSRKTSLTCSRLPGDALDNIKETWKEQTGETVFIRPAYNVKRLINYFTGWKNIMKPGQRWMEIEPLNLDLPKRKAA